MGLFLSVHRLTRSVPWLVGLLICLAIVLLSMSTGSGVNPARRFGPALVPGQYTFLWVYCLAPLLGAAQPGVPGRPNRPHTENCRHEGTETPRC